MKKLIGIFCILLLCGCSVEGYDLKSSLEASLPVLAEAVISDRADNNKPLYRYYIEPQIGRRISTWTGNVFTLNGTEFIMNLDIASIINSRFYNQHVFQKNNDPSAMMSMSGTYLDYSNHKYKYTLDIFDFGENTYFIDLDLEYVNFYGYVNYAEIEPIVLAMMKIGKTVDVDFEKVIATYSSKQSTEYVKEKLDLFETVIPDSGRIEELMGISTEELNGEEGNNEHEAAVEEEVPGDDEGNIVD